MVDDREPTTEEEYDQVNVKVPKRTKELAKQQLEHGGISRVVREALEREAHGERTTERERVKDHLEELRAGRRQTKSERDQLNDELDEYDVKITRAEQRLDELDDREGQYEGMLTALDEHLADGKYVFPNHGMVQRAAEVGDCTPEDVIADLRERNPDLPDERFEEKGI